MFPGLEFLGYEFMQRAFIAGLVIAPVSAVLGVFLVLRGSSMIGDGLAHIAFSGLAFGLFFNVFPLGMALVFAALAAVGIQLLHQRGVVLSDTAIAIFFATGLAVGAVIVKLAGGFNVDLFSYLFGSITTVAWSDVYAVAALGVVLLGALVLLYKELFYVTFSEEAARVSGLPVNALNLAFAVLTAVTIVAAARVVGVLLVSALIVVPAATALQLGRSFSRALLGSAVAAVAAVTVGLYGAFALDLPAGGAIALVSVAGFFGTLAWRRAGRALVG